MRRIVFCVFAGLVASLCFLSFALSPRQASASTSQALVACSEVDVPDAFSTLASDWHTVVVDLESSALVRIYGRILTEAFPTDVAVGVSEHLSSVSAWIGDSWGNKVDTPQAEGANGGNRYLVIEGRAASADIGGGTSVQFVSYNIDGQPKIQFLDIPVQGVTPAATTTTTDDSSGGCSSGLGLSGAGGALCLFTLLRRLRRA